MNETTQWLQMSAAIPDNEIRLAAKRHQDSLTKPPGSLGRLEQVAIQLAALQGTEQPGVDRVQIVVFAADHGVAQEGISAFPQSVTAEMVKNFARGGAAINVLARELDAKLEVMNLGTIEQTDNLQGVLNLHLGPGTANFCQQPAMTEQQLSRAVNAGRQAAERARLADTQLFIGGEMGIGNTTSATALACALMKLSPDQLVGPGTGLDAQGIVHKTRIIEQALKKHQGSLGTPLEILQHLGGFEIASLVGSYMACAYMGIPVLIDGFISSVAALLASRIGDNVEHWLLFSHASAEPGHALILEALNAQPLLNLGMRLGEASGAATTVPLLRLACALHNNMATFAQAGVSEKKP